MRPIQIAPVGGILEPADDRPEIERVETPRDPPVSATKGAHPFSALLVRPAQANEQVAEVLVVSTRPSARSTLGSPVASSRSSRVCQAPSPSTRTIASNFVRLTQLPSHPCFAGGDYSRGSAPAQAVHRCDERGGAFASGSTGAAASNTILCPWRDHLGSRRTSNRLGSRGQLYARNNRGSDGGRGGGRFRLPDETRTPDKTKVELVRLGGASAARMRLEPGWKWSDRQAGRRERCQARHVGLLMSGTIRRP